MQQECPVLISRQRRQSVVKVQVLAKACEVVTCMRVEAKCIHHVTWQLQLSAQITMLSTSNHGTSTVGLCTLLCGICR